MKDQNSAASTTGAGSSDSPHADPAPVRHELTTMNSAEPVPFELRDTADMYRLAQQIAKSEIVPIALRGKPANVFIVLATGRELGLTPMQSVAILNVINGRVTWPAQFVVAKVLQSGLAEYFRCVESTRERATYITRRKGWGASCRTCRAEHPTERAGHPCPRGCFERDAGGDTPDRSIVELAYQSLTWTAADSKAYGLDKPARNGAPSNHVTKPAVMFRWRAAAQLARDVYPEVTLGLFIHDEGRDFEPDPGEAPIVVAGGVEGLRVALGADADDAANVKTSACTDVEA